VAFETELTAYCGTATCVSLANGTDGLKIALHALGIGRGDVVDANAGGCSSAGIRAFGAMSCYVNTSTGSMTLPRAALASALEPGVRAVVAILEIAERTRMTLVEDCTQADGAVCGARQAGVPSALPMRAWTAAPAGGANTAGPPSAAPPSRATAVAWTRYRPPSCAPGRPCSRAGTNGSARSQPASALPASSPRV
jgi:DegT/DnrJ/EryC1/StrS aminotransferase family